MKPIAIFSIIITFILLNCTIEQPQAPKWNLPIAIPLINESYYAHDLSKHFENLIITDANQLGFSITESLDTIYVDDLLEINDQKTESSIKLGNFEININKSITDSSIKFKEFWSHAQNYDSVYTVVPSFSFNQISGAEVIIDQYEYLQIESGKASIEVTNRFPIPIGPFYLAFYDNNNNQMLQIYFPDEIESGKSAIQQFDIEDRYFNNIIHGEISGQSSGSSGNMVFIEANNTLLIEAKLEELLATEAKAKIKPIKFSTSESIKISDDMMIKEAKIKSGQLKLSIKNNIPFHLSSDLVFENIFTSTGENLWHQFDLIYNNQSIETINLNGYYINLPSPSQSINILASIKSRNLGDEFVTVTNQDSIVATIEVIDLKFTDFKGILNEKQIELTNQTTKLDLPAELNNFQLQKAELRLNFHNHINFPFRTILQMKGINAENQEVLLPINTNITAGGENSEFVSTIILNEQNSQLVPFLNNFPVTIQFDGYANLGNGASFGSVKSSDYFFVDYQISAPFLVRMQQQTICLDTTEFSIKPKDYSLANGNDENIIDGELIENLHGGAISLSICNHFPFGIQLRLNLGETLSNLHTNPDLMIGPIVIKPGKFDNNGSVTQEVLTEIELELSNDDMTVFKNDGNSLKKLFIIPEILLPRIDQTIIINADDYIKISAYAKLDILVDPNHE